MVDSDLLLVIDAPAALSVFLPSKLIDYLGAGVPIMGIVPPGTSAALLARLGAVLADPRQPEEIDTALRRALAEARQRRSLAPAPPWGDPVIRAGFTAERVASQFAEILRAIQAGRPR
jgi:hypothetical protein